jgi:hypothetical protein
MGLGPTQGDEKRLLSSNRSPCKHRHADFLPAALERPACAVFCKENRICSFYVSGGDVDDISTKAAPLDAVFWLCIRARL